MASRRGRAVLPAVVTDRVQPGNLFAPFHWNDVFGENLAVNEVTNDAVDPVSFQPEFKVAAVTLTKVAGARAAVRNEGSGPKDRSGSVTAGLGLTRAEPPTLSAEQSHYLQGLQGRSTLARTPSRPGCPRPPRSTPPPGPGWTA